MAESGMDRRPVRGDIARPVRLRCLGRDVGPMVERVTSVAVVVFTADGDLLAADLDRGPVVLEPEEFLRRYRAGDPALMRHFVTAAQAELHLLPQAP
jgi:hypothetical protein